MTYRTENKEIVTRKCSIKNGGYTLCESMDVWLGDSCVNEGGRTNYLSLTLVFKGPHAGLEYYKGIVAYVPKTNGIFLNKCPWCGEGVLNLDAEGILSAERQEAVND